MSEGLGMLGIASMIAIRVNDLIGIQAGLNVPHGPGPE